MKIKLNLPLYILDGDTDCSNGSDEQNCNHTSTESSVHKIDNIMPTCHDWMFQCKNDKCVPYWWFVFLYQCTFIADSLKEYIFE